MVQGFFWCQSTEDFCFGAVGAWAQLRAGCPNSIPVWLRTLKTVQGVGSPPLLQTFPPIYIHTALRAPGFSSRHLSECPESEQEAASGAGAVMGEPRGSTAALLLGPRESRPTQSWVLPCLGPALGVGLTQALWFGDWVHLHCRANEVKTCFGSPSRGTAGDLFWVNPCLVLLLSLAAPQTHGDWLMPKAVPSRRWETWIGTSLGFTEWLWALVVWDGGLQHCSIAQCWTLLPNLPAGISHGSELQSWVPALANSQRWECSRLTLPAGQLTVAMPAGPACLQTAAEHCGVTRARCDTRTGCSFPIQQPAGKSLFLFGAAHAQPLVPFAKAAASVWLSLQDWPFHSKVTVFHPQHPIFHPQIPSPAPVSLS